ncbi:hypothetical protein TNCV_605571 [Trichonephila clavipes]|nr:hypothetical protein TNCV_605571 [Trichonephila clavipes]
MKPTPQESEYIIVMWRDCSPNGGLSSMKVIPRVSLALRWIGPLRGKVDTSARSIVRSEEESEKKSRSSGECRNICGRKTKIGNRSGFPQNTFLVAAESKDVTKCSNRFLNMSGNGFPILAAYPGLWLFRI